MQKRGSPKVTAAQRAKFLDTLKLNGNVKQSAMMAGFDPSTAYDIKYRDDDFAKEWAHAVEMGHQNLADMVMSEMFRRGHDGVQEVVVSMGQVVTDPDNGGYLKITKYSDKLLERVGEAVAPHLFKSKEAATVNIIPADLQPDPAPTPDEPAPEKPIL